jgi:AcrR family transcriptional regulator
MAEARRQTSAQAASERRRIEAAVFELVLTCGYEGTTVEAVCEWAGVRQEVLEREVGDVRSCVEAIYVGIDHRFTSRVEQAYEGGGEWRDSLRAAAYAAADYFAENPQQLRFCTVALLSAGATIMARRDVNLRRFVDMIDAGRQELDDPDSLGRGAAESAIGAIFEGMVRAVSRGGDPADARASVPELMYLAVRPYVGHAEAMEEFSFPPPPPASGPEPLTRNNRELK